jgi:hypothetical protein
MRRFIILSPVSLDFFILIKKTCVYRLILIVLVVDCGSQRIFEDVCSGSR